MADQWHLSNQLKMFMSPREIMHEYQPLDADRLHASEVYGEGSWDTGSQVRFPSKEVATPSGPRPNRNGFRDLRDSIRTGQRESDSELWERKADEAADDGLTASIEQYGVENPVHLGEQFGSMGKRTVVGGHHRIAAANDVDPDMLIPVLHHRGIGEAKNARHGYRYT